MAGPSGGCRPAALSMSMELSDRSKRSWIHGICATQVPIAAPLTKKTPVVAQRGVTPRTIGARQRLPPSSRRSMIASIRRWASVRLVTAW